MSEKYILNGKKVVECNDLNTWAQWFEKADRKVAFTEKNGIRVSTIFLGLDHSWGKGKPLLFESMIFEGKYDQDCERYSTWKAAELGHKKMCKKAFRK